MEFIDYVAEGLSLMEKRDDSSWQLGDLAKDFEAKLGRPDDPDAPTLGDLAAQWGVQTPRVSEWRSVAKFYPDNVRVRELSWRHHNLARRYCDGQVENALELLATAQAQHMGANAFERWVKGIYYEGSIAWHELPDRLKALVPRKTRLWTKVSKDNSDE